MGSVNEGSTRRGLFQQVSRAVGAGSALSVLATLGCAQAVENTPQAPQERFHYALSPLNVFPERRMRTEVYQTQYITDPNGQVARILALHENGALYQSHIDSSTPHAQFSPFQRLPFGKIPVDSPALFHTPDGINFLVGSGKDAGYSLSPLAIWDGTRKDWSSLWLEKPAIVKSMEYIDKIQSYLIQLEALGNKVSFLLVSQGPDKKANRVTEFRQQQSTSERRFSTLYEVNTEDQILKVISAAENREGIDMYTLDYRNGEEIGKETAIPSVRWTTVINPFLDTDGDPRILTGNDLYRYLIDTSLTNPEKRRPTISYEEWFLTTIPEFKYSSRVNEIKIVFDSFGNQHVWVAGYYVLGRDHSHRPFLARYERENPYEETLVTFPLGLQVVDLGAYTNRHSRIERGGIQSLWIQGKQVIVVTISGFGNMCFPLTDTGEIDPSRAPLFPNRGLGT